MIMKIGHLCKLCSLVLPDRETLIKHFVEEHEDVVFVETDSFHTPQSYMEDD